MKQPFSVQAQQFYEHPELIEQLPLYECDRENPQAVWSTVEAVRPELYALLAVATKDVFGRAVDNIDETPPFGLVGHFGETVTEVKNLSQLRNNLRSTLGYALTSSLQDGDNQVIYNRLDYLREFFASACDEAYYDDNSFLMTAGIQTAAVAATASLEAINVLARQANPTINPTDVLEIARHSQAVVNKMSKSSLNHVGSALVTVRQVRGETAESWISEVDSLGIKQDVAGSQRVDFKEPIRKTQCPFQELGIKIGSIPMQLAVIGCPATVKFDGVSAIDQLWSWSVDIADKANLFDPQRNYAAPADVRILTLS